MPENRTTPLDERAIQALRNQHYNGTLVGFTQAHETLGVFRVKPDFPIPEYKPGQYTTLGLGRWEPRHPCVAEEPEMDDKRIRRMIRRAYSISSPVLDGSGELMPIEKDDFVEFYIVMIAGGVQDPPPSLTPRLFLLKEGDRIHIGEKFTGEYTLEPLRKDFRREDALAVFASTGTGEGPHNRMIWDLLRRGFKGQIASIICVRYKKDLAYEPVYRALEKKFPNLSYHTLVTREGNGEQNKMYVQDYLASGKLEERLGHDLRPGDTHFFLCGNPAMIGIPKVRDGNKIWPDGPKGMIQLLEERGFQMDFGRSLGSIHYEKYW